MMQTSAILQSYHKYQSEAAKFGALLLPVSKTHGVDKIKLLYDAGCRDFAENKVQELLAKKDLLPADIRWHLIGHLQTNKVKYVVPFISLIHSVDSEKLLLEIEKQAAKVNCTVQCLLQVHIADEDTKYGFAPDELREFILQFNWHKLKNVQVVGLMGMATLTHDEQKIHTEFGLLKQMFDSIKQMPTAHTLQMRHLSMGMSADYHIALQHGSTMIRIGSAIFGAR